MPTKKKKRKKSYKSKSRGLSQFATLVLMSLVGLLLIGGFLVWTATRPATGDEAQSVCILVVDRTGSFENDSIADRRNLARSTVEGCRDERARMSIAYFSSATDKLNFLADGNGDRSFDLWKQKSQNSSRSRQELEKAVETAEGVAVSAFDAPSGQGSDVITALRDSAASANQSARKLGVDNRFVIMVSDGGQNYGEVNVDAALKNPGVSVQSLIDRVKQLGGLPELDDVYVYFIGPETGAPSDAKNEQALPTRRRQFWEGLVEASGGKVCTYGNDTIDVPVPC